MAFFTPPLQYTGVNDYSDKQLEHNLKNVIIKILMI